MPADTRYAWNNYCGELLKYASGLLFLVFWPRVHRGGFYKYSSYCKNVARIYLLAAGVLFYLFSAGRMNSTLFLVCWDSPSDLALVL